jgi:hypothetical protein
MVPQKLEIIRAVEALEPGQRRPAALHWLGATRLARHAGQPRTP